MKRLAIERLRITGLAGHAPTRAEVEAALVRALATASTATSAGSPQRIEGGRSLADAGRALASALGTRKEPRR